MIKKIIKIVMMLIGNVDWEEVGEKSLDLAGKLASKTPSKKDDNIVSAAAKLYDMANSLNAGTFGLSKEAKIAVADNLTKNKLIIPDLNVSFDPKNGFKVDTTIKF